MRIQGDGSRGKEMTETKITEFIVGVIAAYMFLWLFPIASLMQAMVTMYYPSGVVQNTPVIISAATLVFCIALFGLIAIYCLGACLEKIVLWLVSTKKVEQ